MMERRTEVIRRLARNVTLPSELRATPSMPQSRRRVCGALAARDAADSVLCRNAPRWDCGYLRFAITQRGAVWIGSTDWVPFEQMGPSRIGARDPSGSDSKVGVKSRFGTPAKSRRKNRGS